MSGAPDIDGVVDLVEIGRGGFGVVYRGTETAFGREVAVKVLLPSLDERMQQRFERERRAMGAVSGHPNIATVYRGGVTATTHQPYLVMEYLRGGTLGDYLINVGPIDWRTAASIGAKLADALAVAHRAGILHRDVKPANVFKTEDGEPKLGDFGIARLDDGNDSRSGSITASIAHAPPEIIDGQRGDERADIYSLASTVYTLAVGSPPFGRDPNQGLARMLSRISSEPPPPLHLESAAAEFERVLMRALSKRPEDRPSTVTEFGAQLRYAMTEPTQQVAGPGPGSTQVAPLPVSPPAPVAPPRAPAPVPPFAPAPTFTPAPAPSAPAAAHVPAGVPYTGQPLALGSAAQPHFTHTVTKSRSAKPAQIAGIVALVLAIAAFGGWAIGRTVFGSEAETVTGLTNPAASTVVPPIEPTAAPLATTAPLEPTPRPEPTPGPEPTPRPAPTPTSAAAGTVFTLSIGACFQDPDASGGVSNVETVRCSQPHDNEVYHLFDMSEATYPGSDETSTIAEAGCLEEFEDYVGRDFPSSILNISFFAPTVESWAAGDREVICFVFELNGEPLTGTTRNSGL